MRAIAFDLDGTLFDHRTAATSAVHEWMSANSWVDGGDAIERWFAIEDRRFGEYAAGSVSLQEQRRRRVRDFMEFLDVTIADEHVDACFDGFLSRYRAHWIGFPDARATLTELSARGYVLAVLTNGHFEQQRDKLAAIGLLDVVTHVLASADLPAFKPDRRAFDALCAALDMPAHDIAYVGDDVCADAFGARDAGLRSIHLDRTGQVGPLPGVAHIRELSDLLTQLS